MLLMQNSLRKILENGVRPKSLEKGKQVEKIFNEAVQVCHELWSDDEDEEITNVDPFLVSEQKRLKMGDMLENCHFDVTDQFDNNMLATPSGYNDEEDSEDESAAPIPDNYVSCKV